MHAFASTGRRLFLSHSGQLGLSAATVGLLAGAATPKNQADVLALAARLELGATNATGGQHRECYAHCNGP